MSTSLRVPQTQFRLLKLRLSVNLLDRIQNSASQMEKKNSYFKMLGHKELKLGIGPRLYNIPVKVKLEIAHHVECAYLQSESHRSAAAGVGQ